MSDHAGRPAAGLPLLGPGPAVLGFDVGGTDIKVGVVDARGEFLHISRVSTPVEGNATADAVIRALGKITRSVREDHPQLDLRSAGLVVPGIVDDAAGIGIHSENLHWSNYPFRKRAEEELGLAVAFGHDVRVAGEAEYRLGAAAGFRDVAVVTVGTGIAGALFLGGRLYTGSGAAGEIGHSTVADGPDCACGGRGCLEAVSSAGAIARRYSAATGTPVTGAEEVLARASRGDPDALRIWSQALDGLARGLAQVVSLLAPEAIVIGGGLSAAGAALFEPLEKRLDSILTFQRRPLLLPALLGADAGVIGAALRARSLAQTDTTANLTVSA